MRVRWGEPVTAMFALLVALGAAGCSMSFPLSSLMPGASADQTDSNAGKADDRDVTGSLALQSTKAGRGGMPSVDWTLATAALREALAGKEDVSVPWQNPTTGAQGTVTPVSTVYMQDGFPCRNFLASHVRNGRETWIQGSACRIHRGEWEVRSSRPLQKS
jgi:surface antigen